MEFWWWKRHKEKRKSKRDARTLALYRDWPPMMVDEFLRWENLRALDEGFWLAAPRGYPSWQAGESYKIYVERKLNRASPYEVEIRRR